MRLKFLEHAIDALATMEHSATQKISVFRRYGQCDQWARNKFCRPCCFRQQTFENNTVVATSPPEYNYYWHWDNLGKSSRKPPVLVLYRGTDLYIFNRITAGDSSIELLLLQEQEEKRSNQRGLWFHKREGRKRKLSATYPERIRFEYSIMLSSW